MRSPQPSSSGPRIRGVPPCSSTPPGFALRSPISPENLVSSQIVKDRILRAFELFDARLDSIAENILHLEGSLLDSPTVSGFLLICEAQGRSMVQCRLWISARSSPR